MTRAVVLVTLMGLVCALWLAYEVSEDEKCAQTKCAYGQKPRRLMVYRNWHECFCVGETE